MEQWKKDVKRQVGNTAKTVVGVVGIQAASGAAAGIPGMAGVVVQQGALPAMGLGLMKGAVGDIKLPKKRGRK